MPADIAETLAKLPATPGITYRGMSGAPARSAITLPHVLPTSADPRVATENFTAERVVAIFTITGRFIGPLSRYPDQMEVALLPATLLVPVGSIAVPGVANDVVLLAETGTAPGLPADLPELHRVVSAQVSAALQRPPVTIRSPGRFSPPRA
ncbi:hypothetical protein FZI85_19760 [Mycobacterium sp. CBMA293]|uniref:hypothetical protein n=1 Tax=unclassified Mycolicibacterium TaxID=2636767 RepID=UPI0012DDEEE5|nr:MULTISPECIES: hypothetical protein [unclassified Mycolicibacterium]MUL49066.1 hypothetical protein [Mycolicibacterium sp. CBMA 360]MUL60920.1 hypothetical protein [Mycolicibacterium sp. CBMA 335]MUL71933.1 hypothetical protein [Mycolicibacterium sp. CBMA 311]MUL95861.1 hypothetical protein [Mycolicibacterium sp. CBMA 230]MUM09044.1 hypothetical protein [Mycolicibacterium sp. CBMA 213]